MIKQTDKLLLIFLGILLLASAQDEILDLSGSYEVAALGEGLGQKPDKQITVIIQKPQNIRVISCNSGTAEYSYNPETQQCSVKKFKQQGLRCVIHFDRSVMHYLEQATKAYFSDSQLIFQNANGQKTLQLTPTNAPQLTLEQPDEQVNFQEQSGQQNSDEGSGEGEGQGNLTQEDQAEQWSGQ